MHTPPLRRCALTAAALLALWAPLSSQAQGIPQGRFFEFFGTCSDCTLNGAPGDALAGLVLSIDYSLGDPIGVGDIIAFSYIGSNLVYPYVLTGGALTSNPDIYAASGAMTVGPGPKNFRIEFIDGLVFESFADGRWYTCGAGPSGFYSGTCDSIFNNDLGTGQWGQPVPEPGTYGLMALGLAGLAAVSRRRKV